MQSIPILTLTIAASGTIRAHRFVTGARDEADAGEDALGVSRTAAEDGDPLAVDVLGTTVLELGATLSAGAYVVPDADGKGVAQGVDEEASALLLGGGDDGDLVEALLLPHGPTPPAE